MPQILIAIVILVLGGLFLITGEYKNNTNKTTTVSNTTGAGFTTAELNQIKSELNSNPNTTGLKISKTYTRNTQVSSSKSSNTSATTKTVNEAEQNQNAPILKEQLKDPEPGSDYQAKNQPYNFYPENNNVEGAKAESNTKTNNTTSQTTSAKTDSTKNTASTGSTNNQQNEDSHKSITAENILYWINIEREKAGLNKLINNAKLVQIADYRKNEMFEKQYFSHNSVTGKHYYVLADSFGYYYSDLGENLIQGYFSSAQDVVKKWMASPSHKKNILDKEFKESGISAGQGDYKGLTMWIAVQIFGTRY